jgi:hypothetical protein
LLAHYLCSKRQVLSIKKIRFFKDFLQFFAIRIIIRPLWGYKPKEIKMSHIKIGVISFVAVLLLLNSTACAALVTIELKPSANSAELQAAGHVLINHIEQRNRTIAQIDCWNLKAGAVYSVWGLDEKGDYKKIDTFTTNSSGSGNVNHASSGKFKYSKVLVNAGDDKSFDNSKTVLTGQVSQ